MLPLRTLSYRLPELVAAARRTSQLPLRKITLPVDLLASTEDRVLPSVKEASRLRRLLPNSNVVKLEGAGHVPLLEGVSHAMVINDRCPQILHTTANTACRCSKVTLC